MLDRRISIRLDLLRFPAILGVLFIHSSTTVMHTASGMIGPAENGSRVDLIEYVVAKGLAAPSVPILFMMSGFLLFHGFVFSWKAYATKLRKRIRTLVIPYVIWNLFVLSLYFVGENMRATQHYFVGDPKWPLLRNFSWFDYLRAFGIGATYPISYQFWYVRDLIGLVLLAPVVAYVMRSRIAPLFIGTLCALWIVGSWPCPWPSIGVAFFFCLGAYLASQKTNLSVLDSSRTWLVLAIFVPIVILDAICRHSGINEYIHKGTVLAGIMLAWGLTDIIEKQPLLHSWLAKLSSASFFVFAAHEPLLMIVRRLSAKILAEHSGFVTLSFFLTTPLILSAFLVVVYRVLSIASPAFVGVLTGGRNKPPAGDIPSTPRVALAHYRQF